MRMDENLLAPCGINCALCVHYQARRLDLDRRGFRKSYCTGCRSEDRSCALKSACELLEQGSVRFCNECPGFPCVRLKRLDRRYDKYHTSLLERLDRIQTQGIEAVLQQEQAEWQCPTCGGVICCHNGLCLACDLDTLVANKTYRWGET